MNYTPKMARLYKNAPCQEMNPDLFDATDPDAMETKTTLLVCTTCPVKQECIDVVKPSRSWFDGICGGIVWLNGKPAKPIRERNQNGTEKIINCGKCGHPRLQLSPCRTCRIFGL